MTRAVLIALVVTLGSLGVYAMTELNHRYELEDRV